MSFAKSVVRTGAVIRKELREILRRPGALFSLALGPLLVMALFGIGFTGQRGAVRILMVVPREIELPRDVAAYQKIAEEAGGAVVIDVTDDVTAARARLRSGEAQLLLIAPADARQRIEHGEQGVLMAETNELDPIQQGIDVFVAQTVTREINAEIVKAAATQGLAQLPPSVAQASIKPEVVARPLRSDVQNDASPDPTLLVFFTPAVLALVLQHLGVTLTALSMVRERVNGAVDIFRVAPINAVELIAGKYIAYGLLGLGIAFVLVLGTTNGLHLPFRGSPAEFGVAVVLLTFASLGLGLLISLVADSER